MLGWLLWAEWDFAGAEKAMTRAIELNPNYAEAHHTYAPFVLEFGRIDEALRESQTYLALDPVSTGPMIQLAAHYAATRQYDEAIAWGLKVRQIDPDVAPWLLCDVYYAKGMFEEAADCIVSELQTMADTHADRGPQVGVRT